MANGAEFEGRQIVVTGGTGGLGTAVVERLLASGATVHLPSIDADELEAFPYRDHERVFVRHPVDLADEAAVRAFYESVDGLWGSVQIAGGFGMGAIEDVDLQALDTQFRMNTATCLLACREATRRMRAGGAGGRLVNVAARPAVDPRQGANLTPYVVAKSGVAALTQALATELLDDDVLVNAIAPSVIDTPGNRQAMPNADHARWGSLPTSPRWWRSSPRRPTAW